MGKRAYSNIAEDVKVEAEQESACIRCGRDRRRGSRVRWKAQMVVGI
jgi:hypothetical protein